jgi:uncharacterized membrane protein YhhN
MKTKPWLILYFILLLADLIAIATNLDAARFITKPLLMPLLAAGLLSDINRLRPAVFRNLLLAALFFSWMGDILLLWDLYFLPGLGSFLLAHLAYIGFFLKVRYTNYPLPLCKYPLIFLTEAIVIAFLFFIFPHLSSLGIPVIIYAITVSFTFLCAMHAFRFGQQPMGWYCIAGAILFIFSDAMIAVDRFYRPFPASGIWVMLTYGLAQWALVTGSARYLLSRA